MKIQDINTECFRKYGRVLQEYNVEQLLSAMEKTPLPQNAVVYEPSVDILEELPVTQLFQNRFFGEMPVQVGYCNGYNKLLNAVEYHRNSEINIAVTDLILLLGLQTDIQPDYTYDTAKIEGFFVPAGSTVELFATTLHYAPCHIGKDGFRCVVILPRGTNTDLASAEKAGKEDKLLFAKNKWLIGHREAQLPDSAFTGLTGENISID